MLFVILCARLAKAIGLDIMIGSAKLPLNEIWKGFTGNNDNIIYNEIILNHRLPKAITAILAGASLSVAGVLMQTLFNNPLAGPDVLGVTSGSSLGVAFLTLGSVPLPIWLVSSWGQVIAARIGDALILLLVGVVAARFPQTTSL